jgi:hypothetical protein
VNAGDVVLAVLPQVGGGLLKRRPALFLSPLPGPYQTLLPCGISTRWQILPVNWDEVIEPPDPDFATSGLRHPSIIRLSYLVAATSADVSGSIGRIDPARLGRLRQRLSDPLHA